MGVKEYINDVVKSEEDQRHYRALVLDNDLKVLLVSDPTTDKSAAALDIHIGNYFRSLGVVFYRFSKVTFKNIEK